MTLNCNLNTVLCCSNLSDGKIASTSIIIIIRNDFTHPLHQVQWFHALYAAVLNPIKREWSMFILTLQFLCPMMEDQTFEGSFISLLVN